MGFGRWVRARTRRIVSSKFATYDRALKESIFAKTCLFEAGQGANVGGSMFALVRELAWNPDFCGFKAVFVATKKTRKTARDLLARYGIMAEVVVRDSERYQECLARCKYLFTDDAFPTYFDKRPGQVYVNTWHGTPLKKQGHGDIGNSISTFPNVQKNLLAADYIVFPNSHARNTVLKDFKLDMLYAHDVVMADYPRNDALSDQAIREVIAEEEGLSGKRVIAYMPTWRGFAGKVDVIKQVEDLKRILADLDTRLNGNVVVYVNLHHMVVDTIDYTAFEHIRSFPEAFGTYDFLSACDVLVTDYSSVLFDYAVTGRKIVLFPYDREEYLASVGTYLDLGAMPFPVVETVESLLGQIQDLAYEPYDSFKADYCPYHAGHAARDLLSAICTGKASLPADKNPNCRPVSLRYVETFVNPAANEAIVNYMSADWPDNAVLVFKGSGSPDNAEFLSRLPSAVSYFGLVTYRGMPPQAKLFHAMYRRSALAARLLKGPLKKAFAHERNRLMPGVDIQDVLLYAPDGDYYTYLIGSADCPKTAYVRHFDFVRSRRKALMKSSFEFGGYRIEQPPRLGPSDFNECARRQYYNEWIEARLIVRRSANTKDSLALAGIMELRALPGMKLEDFQVCLEDGTQIGTLSALTKTKGGWLLRYRLEIPRKLATRLPTHSSVQMKYSSDDGFGGMVNLQYDFIDLHQSALKRCRPYLDEERNTAIFFRRSAKNSVRLTVRAINTTDYLKGRMKVDAAYWLAKVRPAADSVVLFEKLSSRYEESASVVFEKLIDAGYNNARFILDADYAYRDCVPEKYRSRIVEKNSVEHYRLFFSAKTFIGSEMLSHCAEINTNSEKIAKRLEDGKLNYVFLQHGVMYMVSLDSERRKFFEPRKVTTGKYRVVTSSEAEKRHFVDRGRYGEDLLYVCGLPKFDRNTWDEDADLVVVMPTWRPWEANMARIDFKKTGYYKLIEDIVAGIPESMQSKIVVLPHPLFKQFMGDSDFPLRKYMDEESRYDDVLRRTKLLITDYSSISYDAFYRGANVVFFWKDKDACMAEYGRSATLMLTDTTAFGDVCYTSEELSGVFEKNYTEPQSEQYVSRYRQIVQFHDGKNTDRLIGFLREDKII